MVSGYLKAVRPAAELAAVLESYWIFPMAFIRPLAHVLPWVELLVGLFLVTGFFTRTSALVSAGLFASFVAALAQSLYRHLPLNECGCFGRLGPPLTPRQSLTMDAVLLVVSLLLILNRNPRCSLDRWITSPS